MAWLLLLVRTLPPQTSNPEHPPKHQTPNATSQTPNPKRQIYMNPTKLMLSAAMTIGLFEGISSVEAAQITGVVTFAGGANLDTSSVLTATAVTAWTGAGGIGSPFVMFSSLSAAPIASFTATTFVAPWSFVSGPIAGFWSVGGYTFDLTSSSIFSQGGSPGTVSVIGSGFLKYAGFDNTPGTWAFTSQNPGIGTLPNFSFSSAVGAQPVSDVGGTASLMGMGLMGLALVRRKLQAIRVGEGTAG